MGWTAVAEFDVGDGDGDPEIVLSTGVEVYLLDSFGNPLGPPHLSGYATQPVVADLDGDGIPEVMVSNGFEVLALEWTGSAFSAKWWQPVSDTSGLKAGAAAYDFDGDGSAEIVYHDADRWYILDGTTGAVLSDIPFASTTRTEIPVIADIDNDCQTEILISGCNVSNRLIAYECSEDGIHRRFRDRNVTGPGCHRADTTGPCGGNPSVHGSGAALR